MQRLLLIGVLVLATLWGNEIQVRGQKGKQNNRRPHILVIMADDLGYGDIGTRDSRFRTPTLDLLMREGVALTQSYMNSVCSPSRAAFLTGIYPFKMGLQHKVFNAGKNNSIPLQYTLLPEKLRELGYKNHYVGKWHLGYCNTKMLPTSRGFDTFYGMYNGKGDYYNHIERGGYDLHDDKCCEPETAAYKVDHNAYDIYSTDLFSDRAVHMVQKHHHYDNDSPLFLFLAYQAVHGPITAPENLTNACAEFPEDSERRIICGMVASMDQGVGKLMDAYKKYGYYDNLITVFISDNGGSTNHGSSNAPFRGAKGTLYEGGTRVINFIHSKKYLKKKQDTWGGIMHAVDWLPTLLSAAGQRDSSLFEIDGVDNWSRILNNKASLRTEFVYNIDECDTNYTAIRVGDYKMIVTQKRNPLMISLYDLNKDPSEGTDLNKPTFKGKYKDKVKQLTKRLLEYKQQMASCQNSVFVGDSLPMFNDNVWTSGWC